MMTGTALGAKEKTTRTITFKNKEHENFYQEYLPKCRYEDPSSGRPRSGIPCLP